MGDDFRYQDAHQYFMSSGSLIDYYNENIGKLANIELVYSTPSMYVDAVNADALTWTTKYDDMFPYADNDLSYWTGFFSSRANDKEYIRRAERTLMASNKLFALNSLNQDIVDSSDLSEIFQQTKEKMMDVIGVTQHHDAATGTGKQHVADDYARLIFGQLENTNPVYAKALNFWAEKSGFEANDWTWCQRTNSTYEDCPIANYADQKEF